MKEKDIVSSGNQMKAIAGSTLDKFIDRQLKDLMLDGIIANYKKKVNFNHVEFDYPKQFLANFLVETLDGKFIVVRRSTSFRHDRAKIGFYDFDGILKHSSFAEDIIATVYLVPDSEIENDDFINARVKIKSKEYYCTATHLLTFSEFLFFLEGYKYDVLRSDEVENEINEDETVVEFMTAEEKGSYYGKRGNSYERELVSILSDDSNLIEFKENSAGETTFNLILKKILDDYQIIPKRVMRVRATNSVPLLMNGGTPKTDIIVTIESSNGEKIIETLSVKNSNANRVSCHDYTAYDYIRVLECEETRLAEYLNMFQENPSARDFLKNLPRGYSEKDFVKLLTEKIDIFNHWVLRGMNDNMNLTVPELQVSNYLLIRKGNDQAFYHMREYITLIMEKSKLVFGVPFGWTYPSKQRGKRIQLKVPLIV